MKETITIHLDDTLASNLSQIREWYDNRSVEELALYAIRDFLGLDEITKD